MLSCVRTSDTVARMGGDEFCIIVREVQTVNDCVCVAEKVIAALSQEIDVSGDMCHIGASPGIALFPDDGATSEELISHSDTAMYTAKKSGKGVWRRWQASAASVPEGPES